MSENDSNSDRTTFKVRLSGEDYNDIVIDWKDTSRPYKQQVFRQLAEITGIPIGLNHRFNVYTDMHRWKEFSNMEVTVQNVEVYNEQEFNKKLVMQLMDGNEYFGLTPDLILRFDDHKNLNIQYSIIPERLIDETECTLNFCHHTDTRTYLNQLKTIVTNDDLRSQLKDSLVEPRNDSHHYFQDPWFKYFRQFNIMQFYYRNCHRMEQFLRFVFNDFPYVAPQLYLRYRG